MVGVMNRVDIDAIMTGWLPARSAMIFGYNGSGYPYSANRTGKAWMPVTLFKHRQEHFSPCQGSY